MLNHILVPIDGSEVAERALEYIDTVLPENGHVTLLTVVDVPDYPATTFYPGASAYGTLSPVVDEQVKPRAEEYLQKTAVRIERQGFRVNTASMIGEPAQTIVQYAKELNVDAILMSTHGRSGISRWLLGSVTNKVLSLSDRPVFVIPSNK